MDAEVVVVGAGPTGLMLAGDLGGEEMQPLRDVFRELLVYPDVQRHLVGMITGLDIRYDMGDGDHPLLGLRMPDQDLLIGDRKTTSYELMRTGRGVVLDLQDDPSLRALAEGWSDRVDTVTATRVGADAPVAALLIRPDGYVAWASSDRPDPSGRATSSLATSLSRWFGPELEVRDRAVSRPVSASI
jgi:bifunctional hydroxylase/dehydrase